MYLFRQLTEVAPLESWMKHSFVKKKNEAFIANTSIFSSFVHNISEKTEQ